MYTQVRFLHFVSEWSDALIVQNRRTLPPLDYWIVSNVRHHLMFYSMSEVNRLQSNQHMDEGAVITHDHANHSAGLIHWINCCPWCNPCLIFLEESSSRCSWLVKRYREHRSTFAPLKSRAATRCKFYHNYHSKVFHKTHTWKKKSSSDSCDLEWFWIHLRST